METDDSSIDSDLDEFRTLVKCVREGSDEAARQLVERYGDALRRAVRRALDRRLRSKFDSLDFAQLVWSSFFRSRNEAFQFDQPADLVSLLLRMARNKVVEETRRRLLYDKSDVNREVSLQEIENPEHTDLAAREPTPDEVAIAREQWDRILQDVPERYRNVVRLKLQGYVCEDIANKLQLAPSTVRRVLNKLSSDVSRPEPGAAANE